MPEPWRARAASRLHLLGPWASKRRKPLIAAALVVAALGLSFLGWKKAVELGYLRYNKWDRRVRGTLRPGDPAPDVALTRYDGTPMRLATVWAEKPAVLVFGSCT